MASHSPHYCPECAYPLARFAGGMPQFCVQCGSPLATRQRSGFRIKSTHHLKKSEPPPARSR